jgi:hypothetical protein
MKNPNDFKKSYALVQIGSVIVYVLVGCLIYVFGGQVGPDPKVSRIKAQAGPRFSTPPVPH